MKILVANRGECAVRVASSCKRLGIETACVYTQGDTSHLSAFDEAHLLETSYLNIEEILSNMEGVDAIHPGWGFLSEIPEFATAVEKAGLIFIGPSAKTLSLCGSKAEAKKLAAKNKLPIIPGGTKPEEIGFPLMIKAALGGGGRGMRVVEDTSQLQDAITSAKREALGAFGSDELIFERLVYPARHIEVQLIGDKHGNLFHLYDRECSLQRRNQKIIEEAPAINNPKSDEIFQTALKIGKAVELTNAATIEFLVTEKEFFFLEVNPRLQVEHPVTEAITGVDLVELQIKAATGEKLSLSELGVKGHAIEARVCAENPAKDFQPARGTLRKLLLPKAPRVDHALVEGLEVSEKYDPMLAKVICHAGNREKALTDLHLALQQTNLIGLTTNIHFLKKLLEQEEVRKARAHTKFIEESISELVENLTNLALVAHLGSEFIEYSGPFLEQPYWRAGGFTGVSSEYSINGDSQVSAELVSFEQQSEDNWEASIRIDNSTQQYVFSKADSLLCLNGKCYFQRLQNEHNGALVWLSNQNFRIARLSKALLLSEGAENSIKAPLPGTVLEIRKSVGDAVEPGETIVVLDSMKMEHPVNATAEANISEILVSQGDSVDEGELLIKVSHSVINKS